MLKQECKTNLIALLRVGRFLGRLEQICLPQKRRRCRKFSGGIGYLLGGLKDPIRGIVGFQFGIYSQTLNFRLSFDLKNFLPFLRPLRNNVVFLLNVDTNRSLGTNFVICKRCLAVQARIKH